MLRFYNSYSRRKEVFRPQKDKIVKMYNCGPTVYDYVHIGNLRSFLFADVLRRYLEYCGFKVRQVMNITDVGHMTTDNDAGEDKMALAVRREGKSPQEVARFYERAFMEDVRALGVKPAWKYPCASEHVREMVTLIKKLIARKHAYLVPKRGGNSVYFDLSTFPRYGKLSGNRVEDLIAGARAEVVHEKRNPYDFALWIYKPSHVLQWETPWGRGYPGWHLECSAMALKYLGTTLDMHTGGEDNKFPHHECEIAQSEGATGKQFARFWLHAKHLLADGKKMSKSAGNFYTLRDLTDKGRSPRAVRYALISTHYREALNFTEVGLKAAQAALARIDELVEKLNQKSKIKNQKSLSVQTLLNKARRNFIAAMDNDLNVPKALAAVFELVRTVNKESAASGSKEVLQFLKEVDSVLGLGIGESKKTAVPAGVMKLVEEREEARAKKDWARSDQLRARIREKGFVVEDTSEGPRLKQ